MAARALGVGQDVDALAATVAWAAAAAGLIGWTVTSSIVPPYLRIRATDPESAARLFRTASTLAAFAGLAVSAFTFLFADVVAAVLLPAGSMEASATLARLLQISAPLPLLWTVAIITASLANARRHYAAAAVVTVVPSALIVGVLIAVPTVEATAVAYVAGMVLQICILVALGAEWRADLRPSISPLPGTLLRFGLLPVGLAFLFLNLVPLTIRAITSLSGPGNVAALDYALRLTTAAESALLSGALAVALTVWSEDRASGRDRLPVRRSLAVVIAVGSITVAVLVVFAEPIVRLLFEGGQFSSTDVDSVSLALRCIAPGVGARLLFLLVLRVLLARQSTWRLAAICGFALVGVTMAGAIGEMASGLAGVGLGYSAGWIAASLLSILAIGWRPRAVGRV